jgi:hypothetical protein
LFHYSYTSILTAINDKEFTTMVVVGMATDSPFYKTRPSARRSGKVRSKQGVGYWQQENTEEHEKPKKHGKLLSFLTKALKKKS